MSNLTSSWDNWSTAGSGKGSEVPTGRKLDFGEAVPKPTADRIDRLEGRMHKVEGDVKSIHLDMKTVRSNQEAEMARTNTLQIGCNEMSQNIRTLMTGMTTISDKIGTAIPTGAGRATKRGADNQLQPMEEGKEEA